MKIAMIPARMGSQRLKQKNLRTVGGVSLIARAIRKAKKANIFDEIWVNSEHPAFGDIAEAEGVRFHRRPEHLGDNTATSEQFVYEFLKAHPCEYLFQVHSIAPLLTAGELEGFAQAMITGGHDVMLSCVLEKIECAMGGQPVNFTFSEKTNSQELEPIQRVTWSVTGWRAQAYIEASERNECATYAGQVGFYPISRAAGHIVKTQEDLDLAEAMLPIIGEA